MPTARYLGRRTHKLTYPGFQLPSRQKFPIKVYQQFANVIAMTILLVAFVPVEAVEQAGGSTKHTKSGWRQCVGQKCSWTNQNKPQRVLSTIQMIPQLQTTVHCRARR
jgi:hypothetical protein